MTDSDPSVGPEPTETPETPPSPAAEKGTLAELVLTLHCQEPVDPERITVHVNGHRCSRQAAATGATQAHRIAYAVAATATRQGENLVGVVAAAGLAAKRPTVLCRLQLLVLYKPQACRTEH